MTNRFGILLENGHVIDLRLGSEQDARATLARWKLAHRRAVAKGELVWPRLPLGFVRFKRGRINSAAGRLGSAGGRARAASLSPARRREIAKAGAAARWGKRS